MPLQIDIADGMGRRGRRPLQCFIAGGETPPLQMWDIIYRRGGVSPPVFSERGPLR